MAQYWYMLHKVYDDGEEAIVQRFSHNGTDESMLDARARLIASAAVARAIDPSVTLSAYSCIRTRLEWIE